MKHRRLLLAVAGLVAFTTTAHAAPVEGTYKSIDLGGSMLAGRASQSWVMPHNNNQGVDDVFNLQSWDGSALGTQWGFSCGIQSSQQTVQDDRTSGTGFVVLTNTFSGGSFYLNPGPWGSGTGMMGPASTTIVLSWFYIDFQIAGARQDVNLSAGFDTWNCGLTLTSANGNALGNTDLAPFPANYPGLLDPTCSPTRINGGWAEVPGITMQINCPVSAEPVLWGRVKAIYR